MKLKESFVKAKQKATSAAVKAKDKIVDTVKENPVEFIAGAVGVAMMVIPIVSITRYVRGNNAFMKSVQELYGPNVTEGCIFGKDPKKLWGMRKNWEENSKQNFDKVKKLVGELDLTPGESFELQKLSYGKYAGGVEITQFVNDFYHDEII